MSDNLTKEQRKKCMSKIQSKKTKPELAVKKLLKSLGFSYQPKSIYGRPDFYSRKQKIVIFIDGCFWHKCPTHFKPAKSNKDYWDKKIDRNVARDKAVNKYYKKLGWKIIRIWEHELKVR